MYSFDGALGRAYESQPMSFVYYQNIDGRGMPVLVSDGFCDKVGMTREQVMAWLPASMFERIHPDDVGIVAKVSREFLDRTGGYNVIFRCMIGDGYRYIHAIGQWQTMPDGAELAVINYADFTDSAERIRAVSKEYGLFQRDRFYRDPLTGLPNVNYLVDYADERVEGIRLRGRTPFLIYSDVNFMQFYNNQYGFTAGNELLRLIADILQAAFPDALIMRGADDHFIVIDAFTDRQDIARRFTQVNERIKRRASGNTTGVQAGICVFEDGMRSAEAVDHAKNALKRIGSDLNEIIRFYSHEADDLYWSQRYIVENFDRAIENGWLKIYYQGITRVETGKSAALEALARWVDPERGVISPGEFIPVLEKYHLLYKLDLFMMEQVCREIPVRVSRGLPLVPVSINFSAQDFDYVDIPGQLNALYERYDVRRYVDRKYFIIEITEQDMATATERFYDQLRQIRRDGFKLWLDDFGSGYSSLNVFSRFDVDLIKFDMELLKNLDDHRGANRRILRAMVEVARQLGIHTLVEGMETEEQRQFLNEIGCELAQGFLFHRPEPLDAILRRLDAGHIPGLCETAEEREAHIARWLKDK